MTVTESGLEGLVERLALLEAERGIMRTLQRYAQALDYGVAEQYLDCFTADATFVVRSGVGEVAIEVVGRQALAEFVAGHSHAPDLFHKHLLTMPVIEVDGDRAIADGYFVVAVDSGGSPTVPIFGRSRDRFVREDDTWRIVERVVVVESRDPDMPYLSSR